MNYPGPFPNVIKIGPCFVGKDNPTFFIADIGANFDGSLAKAKELALAAKEAGADVAKFQTFSSPRIVSAVGFSKMKLRGTHSTWQKPVAEVFKDAEFPREWHEELSEYCKSIGIIFSSAPYDFEAVDLLDSLDVPFIKIGSGDITWHEMLTYIAHKGRPMILGTGASTLGEVEEAIRVITSTGNTKLILLQCITNYPSKIGSANINVIKTYRDVFGVITGYSDHTPGDIVPLGTVALGGKVIEKHLTLDRKSKGNDHPFSMEPGEFKLMVDRVRQLESALGSDYKDVVEEEEETVVVQRRALYLVNDIPHGQALSSSDVTELRPALGILPEFKGTIAGMFSKRDLKAGNPLYWEDLEK
jgi:sialic acid synthase SpsE